MAGEVNVANTDGSTSNGNAVSRDDSTIHCWYAANETPSSQFHCEKPAMVAPSLVHIIMTMTGPRSPSSACSTPSAIHPIPNTPFLPIHRQNRYWSSRSKYTVIFLAMTMPISRPKLAHHSPTQTATNKGKPSIISLVKSCQHMKVRT